MAVAALRGQSEPSHGNTRERRLFGRIPWLTELILSLFLSQQFQQGLSFHLIVGLCQQFSIMFKILTVNEFFHSMLPRTDAI